MSVSESSYGKLDESRFEITYEELARERVEENGPVSPDQVRQELRNELRYDSFTDPEEVLLEDSSNVDKIFENLRSRNRGDELPWDIGATYEEGTVYLRKRNGPELEGRLESSDYWVE